MERQAFRVTTHIVLPAILSKMLLYVLDDKNVVNLCFINYFGGQDMSYFETTFSGISF